MEDGMQWRAPKTTLDESSCAHLHSPLLYLSQFTIPTGNARIWNVDIMDFGRGGIEAYSVEIRFVPRQSGSESPMKFSGLSFVVCNESEYEYRAFFSVDLN